MHHPNDGEDGGLPTSMRNQEVIWQLLPPGGAEVEHFVKDVPLRAVAAHQSWSAAGVTLGVTEYLAVGGHIGLWCQVAGCGAFCLR